MGMTARVTEVSTVVGFIASSAGTAGTFLSDAISLDCNTGRRLVAYLNLGTLGASSTVDAKFRWSATSGGTYADVTGTAMVQDVTASRVDQIEVMVENIKAANPTAAFAKLQVVIGTAATPMGAVIVGFDPASLPVTAGTDVGTTTTLP